MSMDSKTNREIGKLSIRYDADVSEIKEQVRANVEEMKPNQREGVTDEMLEYFAVTEAKTEYIHE